MGGLRGFIMYEMCVCICCLREDRVMIDVLWSLEDCKFYLVDFIWLIILLRILFNCRYFVFLLIIFIRGLIYMIGLEYVIEGKLVWLVI